MFFFYIKMLFCIILTISTIFFFIDFGIVPKLLHFFFFHFIVCSYHSIKNLLLKSSSPAIIRSPLLVRGTLSKILLTLPPHPLPPHQLKLVKVLIMIIKMFYCIQKQGYVQKNFKDITVTTLN